MKNNLYKLPEKRAPKSEEDIYRREFGYTICKHKIYLPLNYCKECDDLATIELNRILFNKG